MTGANDNVQDTKHAPQKARRVKGAARSQTLAGWVLWGHRPGSRQYQGQE